MSEFGFRNLIDLCRSTHEHWQRQAARSVDMGLVVRNWLFGWYIVEYEQNGIDRAEYGERLTSKLSAALKSNGIKGCSTTNVKQFRAFYLSRKEIGQTVSDLSSPFPAIGRTVSDPSSIKAIIPPSVNFRHESLDKLMGCFRLGWSHYVTLLAINDADERRFYEIEAATNSWSVRELERQIASSLYERLALSRDKDEIKRLAEEGLVVETAADVIKNPLVLEFLGLEERPAYSETELEIAIIAKLEAFLLELGKGFLFEARQKRFTFDSDHFYVDLVFYNRLLRCYVLIDLKRDKLTHQDLGQMQMYVNYFDRHVKTADEAPTVGIVLCHRKNNALVELTLPRDANIYTPKYQLYLPSKEELRRKLMDWTTEQRILMEQETDTDEIGN